MNRKKSYHSGVLIAALLLILSACNGGKDKITGIWQLRLMDVKGTHISGNALGDWLWEFNKEGGYLTDVAGAKEKGNYKLESDKLTLQPFDSKNRPPVSYNIARLDSAELDLVSMDTATTTRLYFFKRSAGDVTGDKD